MCGVETSCEAISRSIIGVDVLLLLLLERVEDLCWCIAGRSRSVMTEVLQQIAYMGEAFPPRPTTTDVEEKHRISGSLSSPSSIIRAASSSDLEVVDDKQQPAE